MSLGLKKRSFACSGKFKLKLVAFLSKAPKCYANLILVAYSSSFFLSQRIQPSIFRTLRNFGFQEEEDLPASLDLLDYDEGFGSFGSDDSDLSEILSESILG